MQPNSVGRRVVEKLTAKEINVATMFVFGFWLALLVPWFMIAPLAVMAFDPGPTLKAYIFVFSTWTYPISLIIIWLCRRKFPLVVLLPIINLALAFIGGK